MNVEVDHMEEKAVHSWSRISSAGQRALEEALRVFNPMSKDLTDTETQLVTFLQGLREEGYQPTILSSKDVYGYNSTTADAPPQTPCGLKCTPKMTATVSVASKTQSKNATSKVSSPSMAISVNSTRVPSKHLPRGSTNLLLSSLKQTGSQKSKVSAVGFPSNMYPGVYPAMRLSVVLEALVPFKATASSLRAKLKRPVVVASKRQSSKGKSTKCSSGHVEANTYKCLIKKTHSTPGNHIKTLNGIVLKGPNGRILKENNACKASGILNGRFLDNSSQNCNGIIQTKHNNSTIKKDVVGKVQSKDGKSQQGDTSKKRKRMDDVKETPPEKQMKSFVPQQDKSIPSKNKYNLLKFVVIKVDNFSSDDEVRRRAQKILQVNLSPVIRIRPLPHNVP
ncbi:hypothetical protein FKM82_004483 [Ascaphus truei]